MDVPKSDLTVEAALIVDMTLDAECVLERAQVASAAVSSMPYLGTVGLYNKHWHVDAVALPHNAVRHVLTTLFSTTTSFHALALDVTAKDVALYARYVLHCARFLNAVLDAEEPALYAEAESTLSRRVTRGSGELGPTARAATRRTLREQAAMLRAAASDAESTPALLTAARARSALHQFAATAQVYFKAKEHALPRVISKKFRMSSTKTKIEGKTLDLLERQEGGILFAAMLVCSLGTDEVVEDFASRNFKDSGKRKQFLQARYSLRSGFLQIPVVFEAAAKKYSARFSVDQFVKQYGKGRPVDEVLALVGQ